MRVVLLTACLCFWAGPVLAQTPTLAPCPYTNPAGVSSVKPIGDTSVQGWNTYDFGKLADVDRFALKVQQLVQWGFTVRVTQLNKSKNQVYFTATCVGVPTVSVPPPVNCVVSFWSEWSAWAPINTTTEQRTRTRTITIQSANGGAACPVLTETETRAIVTTPPTGASPDGTVVPPATSITDSGGRVWTLGWAPDANPDVRYVLCDGRLAESGWATALRYIGGVVQIYGTDLQWSTALQRCAPTSGDTPPPPPSSGTPITRTRTLEFIPYDAEYATYVTRFVMRILDAAGATVQVTDLGKPPRDASGLVSVPLSLTLMAGGYQIGVMACAGMTCGPYSTGVDFVF